MKSKRVIPMAMANGIVKGDNIVGGEKGQCYRFTVLADGIVRMEWAPDSVFEDRPSSFAYHRNQVKAPKFETRESEDKLEILTSRFRLTYNKQEFSAYGLYALVYGFTRSLWRYKEQGQPNLGGTYRTLDVVDGRFDRKNGRNIELGDGILSPKGYALLDDSKSMLFDSNGFIAARQPGEGRIDCYLFAYGHDYREAIKAFYKISGPTPLLPRWVLGNWWSRYYAYSADSYLELMDRFRSEKIPLSVAVIDMDWHLVDDPRVVDAGQSGWTGYTWNKDLFPDPPAFISGLHKRNLKVTLNDHPADGIHSYEDIYPKVAKFLGYDPSQKEPIPFDAVDRDYLRAYFDIVLKSLEDDGVDFWWVDWQQGPFSRLKGVDPLWVLNHFHFLHNKRVTRDGLPIAFSRYGGPGSHRYPVGFSGDTITTWDSLAYQPEFTATSSNIGYGWWSHDIGGHMRGVRDDELTTRWVQLGVLSPIMRLHSTQSRWMAKEPWKLPDEPRHIICHFLRLRHRLIPYLQTMNHRAAFEGEPIVQPMYWAYPEHEEAYKCKNQYLFGTEMMVAPITTPQDTSIRLGKVKSWLPPGKFVDHFTGVAYEGNRELWISRPLRQYPVFLKQGAIVPLDASPQPENGGEKPVGFEVLIAIGVDGSFDMLEEPEGAASPEDSSAWDRIPIRFVQKTGSIKIGPSSSKPGSTRSWSVRLIGAEKPRKIHALVDGKDHKIEVSTEENGVLIAVGEVSSESMVSVELGPEPQLKRRRLLDLIEPVLLHAQNEYDIKDQVWAILSDKTKTLEAQLAGLQALDMSPNLRLFLLEYMSAEVDSGQLRNP